MNTFTLSPKATLMYFDITLFRGKASLEEVSVKRLPEAIESLNQTIARNPKAVDAYLQRGRIYCLLDQYKEADKDLSAAIELDPEYADNYRMRGLIRILMERYDDATEDLTKAIALYSCAAIAYGYRAIAYSAKKDYKNALNDLEQAIALEPSNARWQRKKSDVLRRMNEIVLD
ncbi:MAG: tetratricopeptide repeat protein [Candidatus Obscuribacterales bacterium]|jgi:tetratricopeptide (TPR) repeat protein|nr:tetratricopeptide repeat protein [Candidatus Obscuribacterales bacterium]